MAIGTALREHGIDYKKLDNALKSEVQVFVDECDSKIKNGGLWCFGRLMPPTEAFIKSCHDWLIHDAVNHVISKLGIGAHFEPMPFQKENEK